MLIENTDALLFLKTLDKKSVDLILTDPPYNSNNILFYCYLYK